MWPVVHDLGIPALQADALFASALQCRDEPNAGQVRQAVATAIRAFGRSGCAGRVAQEFGDHPDMAVIRMRWARAVAGVVFAEPAPQPGPHGEVGELHVVHPRQPADDVAGSPGAGQREPAVFLAGREDVT
jgi:hypothetical protein